MNYSTEHREVSRTGAASLGWHLGYGYVTKPLTVKGKKYCVVFNNSVIAECRSKSIALRIAAALNKE